MINILNNGYVELIDCMGSDARIIASARISYDGESKGEEKDKKLLGYLYRNKHLSVFEQPHVTYIIKAPIFVLRQLMRHRAGNWNEISYRYVELEEPEFYIPNEWRLQSSSNKQGSYGLLVDETITEDYVIGINYSIDLYHQMIEAGISREMARMILPVSIYSKVMVTFDLRNLLNLFSQRIHKGAQWETQQVAEGMLKELGDTHKFDWTLELVKEELYQSSHSL